jgi:hypothetical protein
VEVLKSRVGRWAALVVALNYAALGVVASAADVSEYEVKAAFILNFTKFVAWPVPAGPGPFCIGIEGDNPFGGALQEAIRNQTVEGRAVEIRHFKLGEAQPGCEIIFVAASSAKDLRAALDSLQGTASLTVGDAPGFCRAGGMIGLHLVDHKVRLEINPDAAQRVRLQLSSKLLALASLVREAGR